MLTGCIKDELIRDLWVHPASMSATLASFATGSSSWTSPKVPTARGDPGDPSGDVPGVALCGVLCRSTGALTIGIEEIPGGAPRRDRLWASSSSSVLNSSCSVSLSPSGNPPRSAACSVFLATLPLRSRRPTAPDGLGPVLHGSQHAAAPHCSGTHNMQCSWRGTVYPLFWQLTSPRPLEKIFAREINLSPTLCPSLPALAVRGEQQESAAWR